MEPRPPNKRTGVNDTLLYYEHRKKKKCSCLGICCIICCTAIIILALVAVLLVFVGIPVVFKKSPSLQRKIVFPTNNLLPSNPEFSNFEKYDIKGARNINFTLEYIVSLSLGVWHLLPHGLVNNSLDTQNFDHSASLMQGGYPVIIHFHSNGGNRIKFIKMYNVLRTYFHVIAFDYRGYADSSSVEPTEEGIVEDTLRLYQWVRYQTNADIYFWGHELGAAIATHTIARLHEGEDYVVPMGLFLEAPFTSMRDQINEIPFFRKLFSWLPWYQSTILNPLDENGFSLNTARYITNVECPIMIVHAEDDAVTPSSFSEKLAKVAAEHLDSETKGNVTLHLLPAHFGYGHFSIHKSLELPFFIMKHITVCEAYRYI
ncbi:hypothetical protein ILUMI_22715 [Ignelater luminosus]|uniref:AB hydrolase-1 domain-containing protein n=1 Tax=Ignelater luminosus TaxID=2038154 RepID=A0A8K0CFB1_IGNLU|nr:hypothetical protein ILUMI_22715 [Ignelater luminosus]